MSLTPTILVISVLSSKYLIAKNKRRNTEKQITAVRITKCQKLQKSENGQKWQKLQNNEFTTGELSARIMQDLMTSNERE